MSLAQPDTRPVLVTIVVVGWVILCGFGGLRALVVFGNAASTHYLGVQDPTTRMAIEAPQLVSEQDRQQLSMHDALRSLDLQLAAPLLLVSVLGIIAALRLLRRRPGARGLLLSVGLLAIAVSGYHAYRSVLITTAGAHGLPDAEQMLPAFFAVAGINVALQSIPLVLVMSLLRHEIVRGYVRGASA